MSQRGRRLDQFQTMFGKRQSLKERRTGRERMDRRARIMDKAGKRQLDRSSSAADGRFGLNYEYRMSLLSKTYPGRETIRTRADDHGVATRIIHMIILIR